MGADPGTKGEGPPRAARGAAAHPRLHPERINNFGLVREGRRRGAGKKGSHPEGETKPTAGRRNNLKKEILNEPSHLFSPLNGSSSTQSERHEWKPFHGGKSEPHTETASAGSNRF